MNDMTQNDGGSFERRRTGGRKANLIVAVAVGAVLLTGCDVTNPGPVRDEFLAQAESHQALVNGAGRMVLEAMNYLAYTGALPAHEIFPGGQTGAHGHSVRIQGGHLPYDQVGEHWENAQQARFIAEDAIRRFTQEGVNADPDVLAQAYNWAGYANRLMGENMCQAVFNGEAAQPNIEYFRRAEGHFNNALELAQAGTDLYWAATAGRAQVRVWLEKWDSAASDAAQIPESFVFSLNADDIDSETRNRVYWANANLPYRAYTVWNTFYEDYYTQTGDPRTPWGEDPEFPYGNASLQGYGQVPWIYSLKYTGPNDDFRLASGREMKLIRAEAILAQTPGQWQSALDLINEVRTGLTSETTGDPLEPRTATGPAEVWTHLKRERGIELWLEARRLGDLRRWEQNDYDAGSANVPDFGARSGSEIFTDDPARCFPIPEGERDANPNIPTEPPSSST